MQAEKDGTLEFDTSNTLAEIEAAAGRAGFRGLLHRLSRNLALAFCSPS